MIRQFKLSGWLAAVAVIAALAVGSACGGASNKAASLKSDGNAPASGWQSTDKVAIDTDAGRSADLQYNAPSGETASGAPSGVTGGSGAAPLPATLDRKIIQTATLDITVDAVSKNFENIGTIAAGLGGFVASSQFGNSGERQTASITIRVPGDKYQDALSQLRKLGEVKGEQSGANDITEEYTDLQSRAKNLQAIEARYAALLGRAANISEVLTVQDRLNATRAEIEQVQGRINLLDHQTELATITVHLEPPPITKAEEPKPDTGSSNPLEVAADSFDASIAVLLGIATVALAVAAFSWWMIPLAIVALVVMRKQMRPTDTRRAPPAPPATPV